MAVLSPPPPRRYEGQYNVLENGLFNDGISVIATVTIAAGSQTLSVAAPLFAPSGPGKSIAIWGAGAPDTSGGILTTTIAAYVSPTVVTIAAPAITALAAVSSEIRMGTDNTQALQTLINSVVAKGGGRIMFPDGVYVLNGPFRNNPAGTNGKAIILLPDVPLLTSPPMTLELVGVGTPPPYGSISVVGHQPVPWTGAILMTTQGDTAGVPGLIGGSSGSGYHWTMLTLGMRNLTLRAYKDPKIIGLNAQYIAGISIENVWVDCGIDPASLPLASHPNAIGIATPLNDNGAFTRLLSVNVLGFYAGVQVNEHSNLDDVYCWWCRQAYFINTATHSMRAGRIGSYHCSYTLYYQNFGGVAAFIVNELNIEFETSGAYGKVVDVYDVANAAYGTVNWHLIQGGVGQVSSLAVTGATNLKLRQITAPGAL